MTTLTKVLILAAVVTVTALFSFCFVKAWQRVKAKREVTKIFDQLGGNMKSVVEAFVASAKGKETVNVAPKQN